jgi:hypothetical protein
LLADLERFTAAVLHSEWVACRQVEKSFFAPGATRDGVTHRLLPFGFLALEDQVP